MAETVSNTFLRVLILTFSLLPVSQSGNTSILCALSGNTNIFTVPEMKTDLKVSTTYRFNIEILSKLLV